MLPRILTGNKWESLLPSTLEPNTINSDLSGLSFSFYLLTLKQIHPLQKIYYNLPVLGVLQTCNIKSSKVVFLSTIMVTITTFSNPSSGISGILGLITTSGLLG